MRKDTKILTDGNIILTGFMGSGKTSVGRLLAGLSGFSFMDTDVLIEEQEQVGISNIFQNKGEEFFRELETTLLHRLKAKLSHTVLSTGGGMPLRKENRDMLKEMGFIVYLEASQESIKRRLYGDTTRPLLNHGVSDETIAGMLKVRTPIYEEAADIKLRTDGNTPSQLAGIILKEYESRRKHVV